MLFLFEVFVIFQYISPSKFFSVSTKINENTLSAREIMEIKTKVLLERWWFKFKDFTKEQADKINKCGLTWHSPKQFNFEVGRFVLYADNHFSVIVVEEDAQKKKVTLFDSFGQHKMHARTPEAAEVTCVERKSQTLNDCWGRAFFYATKGISDPANNQARYAMKEYLESCHKWLSNTDEVQLHKLCKEKIAQEIETFLNSKEYNRASLDKSIMYALSLYIKNTKPDGLLDFIMIEHRDGQCYYQDQYEASPCLLDLVPWQQVTTTLGPDFFKPSVILAQDNYPALSNLSELEFDCISGIVKKIKPGINNKNYKEACLTLAQAEVIRAGIDELANSR